MISRSCIERVTNGLDNGREDVARVRSSRLEHARVKKRQFVSNSRSAALTETNPKPRVGHFDHFVDQQKITVGLSSGDSLADLGRLRQRGDRPNGAERKHNRNCH